MAIHCPTEENANELLKHLDKLGYVWNNEGSLLYDNAYNDYKEGTCYSIKEEKKVTYSGTEYFCSEGCTITEFSDLVEPKLTAKELLEIMWEICKMKKGKCHECPLDYGNAVAGDNLCEPENFAGNEQEIIEICQKWKAEHEKKEPEVEWVWQGRILEKEDENLYQIENATYDTDCEYQKNAEKVMSDVLKEFCKTHEGNYIAIVERVCRIKEEN